MKSSTCFAALLTAFCAFTAKGQSSIAKVDSLKSVLRNVTNDTSRIRVLHQLASAYPDDQYQNSVTADREALEIALKIKSERHIIGSYTALGSLYRRHSDYLKAIANLRMAVASSHDSSNLQLTNTYLELGIACLRMTKLDSSRIFLDKGVGLAIKSGDQAAEASFYNMMGNVLKEQRKFKDAIDYYLKATALFEKLGDDGGLTQTLSNVGNLQNLMGNYDKAEEYALQSLQIAEKINQRTSIAYSNRLLGRIYRKQKKFDDAALVYEKAIKIYAALDAKRDLSETFVAKGNIFYEKSDFANAIVEYRRGLRMNKLLHDSTNMAYTFAALGGAMYEMKQLQASIRYYDSCTTVANNIHLPALVMDSYDGLSTVYSETGNYKLAHHYLQLHTKIKDSLGLIENREAAAELEARYQNEKKENEIRTLNAENEVKALQLQKQASQRNYLVGLIVLSLILIAVLYNRYTIKQKASRKLEELDEIKSRFFANISHEFRTPLSLIIGPLQQKIETSTSESEKEDLKMMKRNAERLHGLINQLLDISKIESGMMKLHVDEGDLLRFIRIMYSSFTSLAQQKKISYRLELKDESLTGLYDLDKVEKIVYNLLSNAFKFTPDDGEIVVTAGKSGQDFFLRVKDSGPGVPGDKLDRIFDRFYQVDDSTTRIAGGTGVGLALSKELAEVHHGKLTVESKEGNGCEFTLTLPLSKELYKNDVHVAAQVERAFVHPDVERTNDNGNVTPAQSDLPVVLVAEDNADMRLFIYATLKNQFRVITAEDGMDALEKSTSEVPDIVVSDWMMPRMDGNTLCEKLKTLEATSHIPVILLTAKADQQSKLEGLQTGADDYLTKPFDARELNVRVQNLVAQRKKLRELFRQQITLHPKEIPVTSPDAEFLNKVLSLIESRYVDPLFGVEEFTQEIGLSRMQLHRKLKALTDNSPGEFLRQFRLERAKQLLKVPGLQISEIAYKTGFNNLSNFTKAFKDFTGVTPSEFR